MSEYDDTIKHAVELVQAAVARDPRKAVLGLLVSDRSLGVGEQYATLWFSNGAELSAFLLQCFPYLYCGIESPEDLPEEIRTLAGTVRMEPITKTVESAIGHLDTFTLQEFSIVWCGKFTELCGAKVEASRSLIAMFRDHDEDEDAEPIDELERDSFADFLGDLQNH